MSKSILVWVKKMTEQAAVNRIIPGTLVFTDSAAQRVYALMAEEKDFDLKLRVYIEGGGCSGFQYGFTFDDEIKSSDMVLTKDIDVEEEGEGGGEGSVTVTLLVDAMSYQYLYQAEIDYVSDLEGERFVIRNPNAKTTCGCGSSFSI